jgi:hypothetical protein
MKDLLIALLVLAVGWLALDDISKKDAFVKVKAEVDAEHERQQHATAARNAQTIADLEKQIREARGKDDWMRQHRDNAAGALDGGARPVPGGAVRTYPAYSAPAQSWVDSYGVRHYN